MRFYRFLNESKVSDTDISFVKNHCKPYLSKYDFLPLKGIQGAKTKLEVKQVGTRPSRPDGTSSRVYGAVNTWLQRNRFCRRDKSVITTFDFDTASNFGTPCYCLPIGNFKFTYVESEDFNANNYTHGGVYTPHLMVFAIRNLLDKKTAEDFMWTEWDDWNLQDLDICDFIRKKSNHEAVLFVSSLDGHGKMDKSIEEWLEEEKYLSTYFGNHPLKEAKEENYETWFECKEYILLPYTLWEPEWLF
jgi:hypothetical protein